MIPHPINFKKEKKTKKTGLSPSIKEHIGVSAYIVQKAPQVIMLMKLIINHVLEHENTCQYEAMWAGNGTLLQQKTNVCGIDWAVNSQDTGIRAWKNESCNGKIFDKVWPAITWKEDHVPKEFVIEKVFGKQDVCGLLLALLAKRWV